tara:strand:+ start:265 stop:717 length:453 start_codon:yes stop_codon:yes gene_type:complete
MSIQDKINKDIKSAMIEKNVDKLAALRAVKSAFLLEMTKDGSTSVSDTIAQSIISKLVKQRKDSYDIFIQQNRSDLAEDERNQISYLNDYLPEQMNEDEVRIVVRDILTSLNPTGPSDLGMIMGAVMPKLKGRADGKLISKIVREELTSL